MKSRSIPACPNNSITVALFILLAVGIASADTALAAEEFRTRVWNIDGFEVEATLVDFNGTQVLLEDIDMYREVFQVDQLSNADIRWLRLEVAAARLQVNLNQMLRGREVWEVNMQSPRGLKFQQTYQAYDSAGAMTAAMQEFPSSRILSVSKSSRSDRGFRYRVRNARLRQLAGRAGNPSTNAIQSDNDRSAGNAVRNSRSNNNTGNGGNRAGRFRSNSGNVAASSETGN